VRGGRVKLVRIFSKIVFRHVYRVVAPTLLTYATMDLGTVVLAYSALSFLGLSVRLPYPDWGYMIQHLTNLVL